MTVAAVQALRPPLTTVQAEFDVFSFGLLVIYMGIMIGIFRAPEFGAEFIHQLFQTARAVF